MSVVEAWTWCRDKVGWSRNRQSWEELLSGAALAIGTLSMALWGWRLPALPQVVLWVLLAFGAAVLLRRGWFKLFGPVLFYDMIRQARRSRYFLLRISYAGLLIFFLFITYLEVGSSQPRMHVVRGAAVWQEESPQERYLRMAESYFFKFMIIQFVAVSLLTPAYVAGAISDEKERGTLEFMLATDLCNREIVLSKLVSRLANLTLFVLTGLPILSFLQFLGGIDPNLLLAGFLATFMTMLGLAGFSIFASVHFKKSRDAVVMSYLGPLVYVVLGWVGFQLNSSAMTFVTYPIGWGNYTFTPADVIGLYNAGNLPIALSIVMNAIHGGQIESVLGPSLRDYVIFHAAVGSACTTWAVLRLRVAALGQTSDTPRKSPLLHRSRPAVWDDALLWKEVFVDAYGRHSWLARILVGILVVLTVGAVVWQILATPLLVYVRTTLVYERAIEAVECFMMIGAVTGCLLIVAASLFAVPGPAAVGQLTMMMSIPEIKQAWARQVSKKHRVALYLWPAGICAAFLLIVGGAATDAHDPWGFHWRVAQIAETVTITGTLVASLMILAVAVRAAGCIAGERDKNTFDFLLTTPLDCEEILQTKFIGCLLSMRRPMIWLGSIWVLGIFGGALTVWEVCLLLVPILTILIYASFFIILGLWFSMVSRSTMHATVFTIMSAAGISGGHWLFTLCCVAASSGGRGLDGVIKFQAGMTPPVVIGIFHFFGFAHRHLHGGDTLEMLGYCIVGLFLYAAAGVFFWNAVLSPRFREMTNREPHARPLAKNPRTLYLS